MAGFRGPLFLLGLAAAATQGGYQNPLPVPPVSVPQAEQAGFRNPLPVPPLSAPPITQAGFRNALPVPPFAVLQPLQPVEEAFSGGYWREYWQLRDERAESDTIPVDGIQNDDEEVLLLFITIMGEDYG